MSGDGGFGVIACHTCSFAEQFQRRVDNKGITKGSIQKYKDIIHKHQMCQDTIFCDFNAFQPTSIPFFNQVSTQSFHD